MVFQHNALIRYLSRKKIMNALLYLSVVLIWGTTWIAITVQSHHAEPLIAIFWRFTLAALCLWVILLLSGRLKKLSRRDHFFCLLQGACVFSLNFLCFYTAVQYINSGLESVIFSMAVLFNAINAYLFFRQSPPPTFKWAAPVGLFGIILLFWHDLSSQAHNWSTLKGIALCALGTYFFSLGNMLSLRHQRNKLDVFSTNAYAMAYGVVLLFIAIQASGQTLYWPDTPSFTWATLYLAIPGSVIGFSAYFLLIGRIGTAKAAYSTLLFPLVALSISTVWEHYQWYASNIAGLLLILLGNFLMFAKKPSLR